MVLFQTEFETKSTIKNSIEKTASLANRPESASQNKKARSYAGLEYLLLLRAGYCQC
jgi:hypothetical protein